MAAPAVGDNCNNIYGGTGSSAYTADWAQWESVTGRHLAVQRKYYNAARTAALPGSIDAQCAALAARGTDAFLAFDPPFNPVSSSVRTALGTYLASCVTGGLAAQVTLWHEPTGLTGMTLALWKAGIAYYGPTVRAHYNLIYCQLSGALTNGDYVTWFIKGAFDGCSVDQYLQGWADGQRLETAQSVADAHGLSLGLAEFGVNENDPTKRGSPPQTQLQQEPAFYAYVQNLFVARKNAGKPNGYLCHFTDIPYGTLSQPEFQAGSPQVRLYRALYDAVTPGTLTVTTTGALPGGTTGTAYDNPDETTVQLTATGGTPPYTWVLNSGSLAGSGLTLNSDGTITGTSGTAATYTFTAKATDSVSATAISGSLTVTIAAPPTVTTTALPGGTIGTAYLTSGGASVTLTAANGSPPYTWAVTVGTLPAGLSLAGSTGIISGTPTTAGTSSFTVQATDATAATGTAALSITVSQPSLLITNTSLPAGYA